MRLSMNMIKAPENAIDVVGTGGDGSHTFNISTASAFVAAACGAKVAKHGNKGVSSLSGASDVLSALGVNINAAFPMIEKCINEFGLGYMAAVKHHPAMRHVAPVRQALGVRTIFNMVGPLSNPAGAKRQLIGVYDQSLLEPMALTLKELGSLRAWLVHGSDHIDEITISGATQVVALEKGEITQFSISPEDFGIKSQPLSSIRGGSPEVNARAMEAIFTGEDNAYADTVALNAGACLTVAEVVPDMQEGVKRAQQALKDGSAARVLQQLRSATNQDV